MSASRIITNALKTTQPGAAAASVSFGTSGGPAWGWGVWTEYIAVTAAEVHVAGLTIAGGVSNRDFDFDIGVGAAGAEVSVHTVRLWMEEPSNGHQSTALLPVPLGGFPAGSRVSLRGRRDVAGGPLLIPTSVLYYENYLSSHDAGATAPMTSAPLAASMVTVTPSATAWASSPWVEVLATTTAEASLLGINVTRPVTNVVFEFDIATGGVGAETVISTLRGATRDSVNGVGMLSVLWLPMPYPVPAGTRLSVRMRKSDVSTTAHGVSLLYIHNTALL